MSMVSTLDFLGTSLRIRIAPIESQLLRHGLQGLGPDQHVSFGRTLGWDLPPSRYRRVGGKSLGIWQAEEFMEVWSGLFYS